jgi:outer membrane protein TolC
MSRIHTQTLWRRILPAAALAVVGLGGCSPNPRVLDAAGGEVCNAYVRNADALEEAPLARTAGRLETPAASDPDPADALPAAQGSGEPQAGVSTPPAEPARSGPAGFVEPLAKSADRAAVTLEACLRRALVNNLKIQIARFAPAIARTAVVEAEALFDPSWFLNNALSRLRQDTGTFLAGAGTLSSRQWDFQSGARSLLPTGASVALSQGWTMLDSNSTFYDPNPRYATDIGLSVAQPLLRGAGLEVTKSPIVLARLDHQISLADFKRQLIDTLLEVEQTYWELTVAEVRVDALAESLSAAEENLRIVRRRFEEGKDKRVIVSLAESAVTNRQTDLIVARLQRARTSDHLKRLINDPALPLEEPTLLATSEQPLANPVPTTRAVLQRAMLAAMKYRPEIQQADARLQQMGLLERVARNQRLPRLDLQGAYGLTGLDSKNWRAMKEQFSTEFYDWTVGLELEVPIGNRSRMAAYERAQLERTQALVEREDTRQQLLLEVSNAVRDLAAAEEAVAATRAARQAAEQTLHDQQANVGVGAALQKDLLDAQRDLADAKVREIQSMAAYMTSLAQLERAKGTLLEYNNIRILDEDAATNP